MLAAALLMTENNMELEEVIHSAERPEALGPVRLIVSSDKLPNPGRQRINVSPTFKEIVNTRLMLRPVWLP